MVLPSGETSSESHVPSSVVNSILRSGLRGNPFFSFFLLSFLWSFFYSFLSFSCSEALCRFALASSSGGFPRNKPPTIANVIDHAARLRGLGFLTLMLDFLHTVSLEPLTWAGGPLRTTDERTLFWPFRGEPCGSVSIAHSNVESALLLRLHLAATPAARLRRHGNDVRNARVVHLLIQRGEFFLGDSLDLRRSIIDQRRQFRELFFLVSAGGGRKTVQIIEKILHLIWQRIGLVNDASAQVKRIAEEEF